MQNINANRGNVVSLQARSNRQNEEPLMEKNKALDAAVAQIERAFGKGSIMKLGEQAIENDIAVIPTGCAGGFALKAPRRRDFRSFFPSIGQGQ